jgi:hypothetical protein
MKATLAAQKPHFPSYNSRGAVGSGFLFPAPDQLLPLPVCRIGSVLRI